MAWMDGKVKKSDYPTSSDYYLAVAAACEKETQRMESIGDHIAADYFRDRAAMDMELALELASS